MNEQDRNYLFDLAKELENGPRIGTDENLPEGAQWVQISDELANLIANRLYAIVACELLKHEYYKHNPSQYVQLL